MLCKLNLNLFKLWESGNILVGLRVAALTQKQLNCNLTTRKVAAILRYQKQHSLNEYMENSCIIINAVWIGIFKEIPSSALIDWQKISRQIFSQSVSKLALLAGIFPHFVFMCIVIGLLDCLVCDRFVICEKNYSDFDQQLVWKYKNTF